MIKKLLTFITIFCLMMASVSALVRYTGSPQLPYLIFGTVEVNGNPGNNVQLTILNQGTGFTKTVTANADGYWQEDVGNWFTSFAGRPPVQFGDNIVITAVTGCGTGDTCVKSFLAFTPGYGDWAKIDFKLTGTIPTPPPPPPPPPTPSSGGNGGSSGGGSSDSGRGSGVRWDCEDWTICKDGEQKRVCTSKDGVSTSSQTQGCIESKPTPTPTPDTSAPKEPVVTPTPTTPEPTTPVEPTVIPDEDPNELRDMLLKLIASIIGIFAWGAGFRGLIVYYLNKAKEADKAGNKVLAAKHRARAEKMAKTVITNFLAGKYKK